jgi:hypothetical protein
LKINGLLKKSLCRDGNRKNVVQDLLYLILVFVILIGVDALARGLGKL